MNSFIFGVCVTLFIGAVFSILDEFKTKNSKPWKTIGTINLTLVNHWTGKEFGKTIILLEQEETNNRKYLGNPPMEVFDVLQEWKRHTISTEQLLEIWS